MGGWTPRGWGHSGVWDDKDDARVLASWLGSRGERPACLCYKSLSSLDPRPVGRRTVPCWAQRSLLRSGSQSRPHMEWKHGPGWASTLHRVESTQGLTWAPGDRVPGPALGIKTARTCAGVIRAPCNPHWAMSPVTRAQERVRQWAPGSRGRSVAEPASAVLPARPHHTNADIFEFHPLERPISHPPAHSPAPVIGLAQAKPGAWNSIQVSRAGGRGPSTRPSLLPRRVHVGRPDCTSRSRDVDQGCRYPSSTAATTPHACPSSLSFHLLQRQSARTFRS